MPGEALLRVEQVGVRFGGIVALDGVSFDVAPGRIVGLIGPNGAGKTTLFNCVCRLYDCERGAIVFDGQPLLPLARYRVAEIGIGRTFQNLALFRSMSVLDNVMVGRHCRTSSGFFANALRLPGVAAEQQRTAERARELVHFVGLDALAATPVAALPFPMQKRVELARALASDPKLLLLDEPTAGMNPGETAQMTDLIKRLRDELNLTVLLIEHDMKVVMGISERITVLDHGELLAEGRPEEIRSNPAVIEAYLGKGAATA